MKHPPLSFDVSLDDFLEQCRRLYHDVYASSSVGNFSLHRQAHEWGTAPGAWRVTVSVEIARVRDGDS